MGLRGDEETGETGKGYCGVRSEKRNCGVRIGRKRIVAVLIVNRYSAIRNCFEMPCLREGKRIIVSAPVRDKTVIAGSGIDFHGLLGCFVVVGRRAPGKEYCY